MALHKEPEVAINAQNPEWHSQKNLIALLSANLPSGYRLFVREHRFNEGRRPTKFYTDICRYPGVNLIDPFDSQFKYIRNASLIVTENGTTGFEGLIFGRRVLLLSENFYSAAGLAPIVEKPGELGERIVAMLREPPASSTPDWDRRLSCLIDAEYATTLPDDDLDEVMRALAMHLERAKPKHVPSSKTTSNSLSYL